MRSGGKPEMEPAVWGRVMRGGAQRGKSQARKSSRGERLRAPNPVGLNRLGRRMRERGASNGRRS
eukprot:scaffold6486_cov96-Cylindrotheca_fusiformis.AAC.2